VEVTVHPVSREDVATEVELVRRTSEARQRISAEVAKRIVGQRDVVEQLLVALFAGGHGLLIGVPGLAKTTLVSTVAQCLDLAFSRIQFTPDLMPSDVTGTEILEEDRATGRRTFRFVRGPVFTNVLLADEINRTPPKTQAALLEAMQEGHVTVAGTTYPVESPFLVFATQNPIEQEGTYPLPEAQLDRFMLAVRMDYPDIEDEVEVVKSTTGPVSETLEKVLTPAQVLEMQAIVRRVPTADFVVRHAVGIVRRTRPSDERAPKEVRDYVAWGAGPRAAQHLVLAAKAFALLRGEFSATPDHVDALAVPVLAHRVVVNFHAEAERVTAVDLVRGLVQR
jgi:MoxR-like ATPase